MYFNMQYKFFVDGEWRHDEHQPFVNGNYGVVNTVFIAREPDVVPNVQDIPDMEVDDVVPPVRVYFTFDYLFVFIMSLC